MKRTTLLCGAMLCVTLIHAQFYKSLKQDEAFTDSLTRIVSSYKLNFYPLQGVQLTSQAQTDVYSSTLGVPGALHCVIQRYHSVEDTTASWQAIMYEGEDYAAAVKIYKATYQKLRKAKLRFDGAKPVSFDGAFQEPAEETRFVVSPLRLDAPDEACRYFSAELELVGNYDGWEVHLNLHKKRDDREQF